MSLFENDLYQWRETYFVLFDEHTRPQASDIVKGLAELDAHFEVTNVVADEVGRLESLTLRSPEDSSAMDITHVAGEEVAEQINELLEKFAHVTLDESEREKLNFLGDCNARYDIFHFEESSFTDNEDEEILDPGGLLLVIERLTALCQGVGIDPQSGSFMQ